MHEYHKKIGGYVDVRLRGVASAAIQKPTIRGPYEHLYPKYHNAARPEMLIVIVYGSAIHTMRP